MATIIIKQGESVDIQLADTDGCFTITYSDRDLIVTADMPDPSGRVGVIYHEPYADLHEEMMKNIVWDNEIGIEWNKLDK